MQILLTLLGCQGTCRARLCQRYDILGRQDVHAHSVLYQSRGIIGDYHQARIIWAERQFVGTASKPREAELLTEGGHIGCRFVVRHDWLCDVVENKEG